MSETTFLAAVLFLILALVCGGVIQWGVSKVKAYKPPVSILWFVFGMIVCAIEIACVPSKDVGIDDEMPSSAISIDPSHPLGLIGIGVAEAARIHSSVLYYIVLPILLYDATQQISWYHFAKNLKVGLLLAILGVILQVALIGVLMQWSFNQVVSTNPVTRGLSLFRHLSDPGGPPMVGSWPGDGGGGFSSNVTSGTSLMSPSPFPPTSPADMNWSNWDFSDVDSSFRSLQRRDSEGFLWPGPNVADSPVAQGVVAHTKKKEHQRPTLSFAMMTASAVASTDPIAVISILEEMEAPPHFNSLFDCESLINDGSSIFLFTFFKSLTRGQSTTWQASIERFATLLLVGPTFGLIIAALMYRWLKHFQFFPYDETLAVVFMAYLVFFTAEIYLRTSGPLTIVVYGLYFKYFAKAAFAAKTMEIHHHFVRGVALAATSVVFIISGVASMRMMWDALTSRQNLEIPDDMPEIEPESLRRRLGAEVVTSQLWRVPVFYIFVLSARFIMIGLFFPIIRRLLGGFTWKEYVLLSWGGLRGAVCLILGLLIEQDDHIDSSLSSTAALYIASSAFLSLFCNGLTFEFLYKLLRPYNANPFKQVYLRKVMKYIDREYFNEVNLLQSHWLFDQTWAIVYADRLVPRLGRTTMDSRGKIRLEMPKARRLLRELKPHELRKAVAQKPETDTSFVPPDETTLRRSESKSQRDEETTGHVTAAVLQKLRRAPDQRLDMERNLEVLEMEEEEPAPDVISRQISKQQEDNQAAVLMMRSQEVQHSREGMERREGASSMTLARTGSKQKQDFYLPPKVTQLQVEIPSKVCFNVPASNSSHSMTALSPPTQRLTPATLDAPGARSASPTTAFEVTPFRRVPGYKNDFISRIRSEPYGGTLDAATLESGFPIRAEIDGSLRMKVDSPIAEAPEVSANVNLNDWDDFFQANQTHIPRTMSVPNQIARRALLNNGGRVAMEASEVAGSFPVVTHRDREGEIQIMVVNTMRQLYKRMYDQNFISGTTFVEFQSIGDVVSDFAILDVAKKSSLKAWKDVFKGGENVYRAAGQEVDELEETVGSGKRRQFCAAWFEKRESRQARMERLAALLGTTTGWDLEWRLVERRLARTSRKTRRIQNALRCALCRGGGAAEDDDDRHCGCLHPRGSGDDTSIRVNDQPILSRQRSEESKWRKWNRRFWASLWSLVGPRQIFPALDDLQMLCAFVDVHDEMLMRGDQGLRIMLGNRLLPAFEAQIRKAREAVNDLQDSYPDSFPYAMICHAAIFLLNLKTQLVEEFFEKGLLLAEDKDKICEFLIEQVVAISKYHPPYLFT